MSNINLAAYDKLSAAFAYAQQIKGSADARGANSVVRLQGGDALACSYSNADASRGLFNRDARSQDQKALNDAARDKIVQFLTGNRRATFADADPATQRKAGVLMSVMHQGSFGIAMGAVGTGFDPQDKDTKFMATGGTAMGGAQTNGFSVTKDGAGNITIKGTAKFLRHATLMANNDKQQLTGATDDDGSYVQYNIEIRIPAGDMDKFAEADWTKCSTAEATRIEQNNHLEDRFQKAADTIGDGYKFTGSVNVSLKAKINAVYDLPTMYERNNNRNNH